MMFLLIFVVMAAGIAIVLLRQHKKRTEEPPFFPTSWRTILQSKVVFYAHLDEAGKQKFEQDVLRFLANVKISGVKTTVDITDKLLVASSAVIPVFGFPEWDYTFLDEVLLYPAAFDFGFSIENRSEEEYLTGMVGTGGVMEGKMILSKPALYMGFDNTSDKRNVGIHEFIHLLDKEDGTIDGVPTILNKNAYALPWIKLIRQKMEEINNHKNEIDTYGATNESEFLAVAGEYFFEHPHLLQKNHPELYALLSKAFNQDTTQLLKARPSNKVELGRNSRCPCGSGKKYKACCMKD